MKRFILKFVGYMDKTYQNFIKKRFAAQAVILSLNAKSDH